MTPALSCAVGKALAGSRLDAFVLAFLASRLGPEQVRLLSKSRVRLLLQGGRILVDRVVRTSAGFPLREGMRVDILDLNLLEARRTHDRSWSPAPADILFRDDDILAVNKPAGLPVEAGHVATRMSVASQVASFLGMEALHPAHRLDKETSGVLVFGLSPLGRAGLAASFREGTARKTYLALTLGGYGGSSEFSIEAALERKSPASKAALWGIAAEGGLEAATDVRVLERHDSWCLVEARPRTGRTHQIRVHLASVGLALLGDTLYGGPRIAGEHHSAGRVMLHAARLSLPHPAHGGPVELEAPLPEDFNALLSDLRAAQGQSRVQK